MDVPLLADAVDAAEPLLQAGRVPGQVIVDHQPAELEVDPLACRFGRHADLFFGPELLLGAFPLVRVHAAVDLAGGVTPAFQRLTQVIQRIAVLGEDEQLAPPVAQFLEFGPLQASLECGELRIRRVVTHTPGMREEIVQGRDFGAKLVKARRRGELVHELVALGVVEVVLILLHVGDAALQLGQPARPLGGWQILQLGKKVCCFSKRRRIDSKMAIVELASRRWKTVRARATLACLRPLACGRNWLI